MYEDIEIEHLRQQIEDCAEYLKEGETPAECIERNRNDAALTARMLAKERKRVEELEDQITELPTIIRRYQKDAERYLDIVVNKGGNFDFRVWVGDEDGEWIYPITKDETDRAIDAARAEDKK